MCGAAETFVIPGRAAGGIRGGGSHRELRTRRQLCAHRHLRLLEVIFDPICDHRLIAFHFRLIQL